MAMANLADGDGSATEESYKNGELSKKPGLLNGDYSPTVKVDVKADRYGFVGGNQYTNPEVERRVPPEILRKREMKWLDMLVNWDKWMSKKFKKVKERCRKGIPPSIRARAWQYLCGSYAMMEKNKGVYEEYLKLAGDPKCIDDIHKDVDRQFPSHEMFLSKGGHGQESLFDVLKAYSIHRPIDGYCQAQAPIASILLMHMPAEQAFWCLIALCDKYLIGYYSPGLEAIQLDGDVLFGLLKRASPSVYKHLKKNHVEPIMYMMEWFMCAFIRNLPWSVVLRIWDQFLCEGVKVLFRVGLVLIKFLLEGPDLQARYPTQNEVLERLRMRRVPPELQDEEFIFRECLHLGITERDMEKEHHKQVARRKAAQETREREKYSLSGNSSKEGKGKNKRRT